MHVCTACGEYCDCQGEMVNSPIDGPLTIVCIHECDISIEEDFEYDDWQEKENEDMAECICGAYVWSQKSHKLVMVADCICGRV